MRNNGVVWGAVVLGLVLLLGLIFGVQLNNSVSAVDQRSKALEARLNAVADDAAFTALEQRQADLEAKIATLAPADLKPLESAMEELRTGLARLESRFATFTPAGLDELTARLDTLEQAVTAVRTDLGAVTTQLGDFSPAALDTRLTSIETNVAALGTTAVDDDAPTANPEVAALGARIEAIESRLAAITEPDLQPLEARIEALDARLAAISFPSLLPIEERIAAIDARLTELAPADLGPLQGEIASIQTDLMALRGDLASKATPADVAVIADQLTAIGTRIDALPSVDVGPLSAAIGSLEAGLQGLQAQVADLSALRTDVDGLKTNPPAIAPFRALESIYFGAASTSPSGDELAKIAALAQRLGANPGELSIVGFSDSSGPAELNRSLSLRRAAAVRLALINAGVPGAAVTSVTGLGEDAPPVATDDDTEEAGNRVAVIYGR